MNKKQIKKTAPSVPNLQKVISPQVVSTVAAMSSFSDTEMTLATAQKVLEQFLNSMESQEEDVST